MPTFIKGTIRNTQTDEPKGTGHDTMPRTLTLNGATEQYAQTREVADR